MYTNNEISKGKEKEQGIESQLVKILADSFPKLGWEKVMKAQKAQRIPIKMNQKDLLHDIP